MAHRPAPSPVPYLAANGGMGAGFGLVLATLLVLGDVHGLATLMDKSIGVPAGWALLAAAFGSTFGGIATASAVMLLDQAGAGRSRRSGSGSRRLGRGVLVRASAPVRAPSQARRL